MIGIRPSIGIVWILLVVMGGIGYPLSVSASASSSCTDDSCSTCVCASKSAFVPRRITQDATFQHASTLYQINYVNPESSIKFYGKTFVQRSRNGKDLARYFLPKCKSSVLVKENGIGDINALWFGVIAPPLDELTKFYESTYTLCPIRTAYGSSLDLHLSITDNIWVNIYTAIMHVRHDLNPAECNRSQTGALNNFVTFLQAMNNKNWCFGKIPFCSQSRTGVDDIKFEVGYNFNDPEDEYHAALYALVVAPTGKKPTAETLFEPLVGSRHAAVGGGFNGSYIFWENDDKDHRFAGLLDVNYRYAFSGTELRSFDLTANKDWSRYLLMSNQSDPLVPFPGINILTLPVSVTPRSSVNFLGAFHYQYSSWDAELGYNFWWRDSEKIELCASNFPKNVGIYDLPGIGKVTQTTASTATIAQPLTGTNAITSDAEFTSVKLSDLNVCSAKHPRVSTHKAYGTVTWHSDNEDYNWLIGLGGSYEFTRCAALEQWAVWLNTGFIF